MISILTLVWALLLGDVAAIADVLTADLLDCINAPDVSAALVLSSSARWHGCAALVPVSLLGIMRSSRSEGTVL